MSQNLSEDQIQAQIVQWYNNTYCLKHHQPRGLILSIPNGGTRNRIEALKLKAIGLLPGASDLIIYHPVNKSKSILLWVEVKTETGRQSAEQIEFEKRITELGGQYWLVRSLSQLQKLINSIS